MPPGLMTPLSPQQTCRPSERLSTTWETSSSSQTLNMSLLRYTSLFAMQTAWQLPSHQLCCQAVLFTPQQDTCCSTQHVMAYCVNLAVVCMDSISQQTALSRTTCCTLMQAVWTADVQDDLTSPNISCAGWLYAERLDKP